jgi:hypothetical protein
MDEVSTYSPQCRLLTLDRYLRLAASTDLNKTLEDLPHFHCPQIGADSPRVKVSQRSLGIPFSHSCVHGVQRRNWKTVKITEIIDHVVSCHRTSFRYYVRECSADPSLISELLTKANFLHQLTELPIEYVTYPQWSRNAQP